MKPKIEVYDDKVKVTITQNKIIDWLIKQNTKKIVKQLQKQGIIPKQGMFNRERSTQTIMIIMDEGESK